MFVANISSVHLFSPKGAVCRPFGAEKGNRDLFSLLQTYRCSAAISCSIDVYAVALRIKITEETINYNHEHYLCECDERLGGH